MLILVLLSAEFQESGLKLGIFGSKRPEGVSVTCFSPVTPAGTSRVAIGRRCGVIHVIQFSEKEHEVGVSHAVCLHSKYNK